MALSFYRSFGGIPVTFIGLNLSDNVLNLKIL